MAAHLVDFKSIKLMLLMSMFGLCMVTSELQAACVDNGNGSFTCSGTSTNTGTQIGKTQLDNSGAPAILNNTSIDKTVDSLIANDPALPNTGPSNTIEVTGGGNPATINNSGTIQMLRGFYTLNPTTGISTFTAVNPTSILFTDTLNGALLNNGTAAGVDTAIYTDASTPLLTINNTYLYRGVSGVTARGGTISARGNFSAAVFGDTQQIVINNGSGAEIRNDSHVAFESYNRGHWSIATYGGAVYTPPAVLNGTQYADVQSAGSTVINNTGFITGSILVVDSNPLLKAAQERDASLVLAYTQQDVGPRNSVINNTVGTDRVPGVINGNIYLGSGAHTINNGTADGAGAGATINGNIFVDQRATAVTSVTGGISTPEYLVAGDRTFTFNQMGQFTGTRIEIHDVAESVNNINIFSGLSNNTSSTTPDPNFDIVADGLGINNLNLYCLKNSTGDSSPCQAKGNWTGLSSMNVRGSYWSFAEPTQIVDVSGGDINLEANRVVLGGSLIANNVIVNNRLEGVLGAADSNVPGVPSAPDFMGSVTGNLINNGDIIVRTATFKVNGNAIFNADSTFSLRITDTGNGMLNVNGGNGTFSNTTKVFIDSRNIFFRNGDTFTIATNSSGTPILVEDIGIVQFTSSDATGDIILTARVGIPDYLNVNKAGNNAINVIMNYGGTDPGFLKLRNEIPTLSEEELKRAAERLRPEINDGLVRMTLNHSDRVLGVVESHLFETSLAALKNPPREPIDGKLPSGSGIWFQGFGGKGDQEARKNVDGYIATSTGMAAGIDRLVGARDDFRLGVAGAYAYGNIDNSGITDNNRTNVNSYLGFIYGAWNGDPWYINAAVGGGRHTYATERIALGRSAQADHESWQATAKVDAGWPMPYNDLLTFVPLASFSYSRINEDGYTERGTEKLPGAGFDFNGEPLTYDVNSATNLRIANKRYDSYRSGLGSKMLLSMQQPDYNAGIELRAMYVHEFGDLTNNSTAQFVHGGPSFYSPGVSPSRDSVIVGSSVRLTGNDAQDQLTLLASYDAEMRSKYVSQALTLMLRYDFDQGANYLRKAIYRSTAAASRKEANLLKVKASEDDVQRLSQAMRNKNSDMADELLAADLTSSDPKVKQDAIQRQAIKKVIDNWINSFTNSNQQVYFNSYAADFVNDEGLSRQQWERKRRQEFKEGTVASIKVADLNIKNEGNSAFTIFTQISEKYNKKESIRKILELEKRGDKWLIVSEDNLVLN